MTAPDHGRRRLLAGIGAIVGLGALGGGMWRLLTEGTDDAPVVTPPAPPPSSSTGVAPAPTTSAPSATPPQSSPPTSSQTTAPGETVTVIGRDGWGAAPVTGELVEHTVALLTVHHSAERLDDPTEAPARLRRHQWFHQLERGWPDLAYHYVVDGAGNVYEGRAATARGDTATDYDPTGHLLVCCEGNFEEQPVPEAQLRSLVTLLAWAAHEFAVDPATIRGHRDYAATSCPGRTLAGLVDTGTLEAAVRSATAPASLGLVEGAAAARMVAAIEAGR